MYSVAESWEKTLTNVGVYGTLVAFLEKIFYLMLQPFDGAFRRKQHNGFNDPTKEKQTKDIPTPAIPSKAFLVINWVPNAFIIHYL